MDDKIVVTIARGFGSGGKTMGRMLSERLHIPYYDRDILSMASEKSGINEGLFGEVDERLSKRHILRPGAYTPDELIKPDQGGFTSDRNLFNYQAKVIRETAERESCVIVGRCADFILKDMRNVVRVYVHADEPFCIEKVLERYDVNEKEALEMIHRIDKERADYCRYFTGREWNNADNYDLCLNSSELGFQKCVDIICSFMEIRMR